MLNKKYNVKSGKYTVTFQIPSDQLPEDMDTSQINIVGNFNNWSISETPMEEKDGGFKAKVKLKPGKYEFRYLINDTYWYNDWEADGYEPNRLQNADNCLLILDKPKKEKKKKDKKEKKGKKGKKGKKEVSLKSTEKQSNPAAAKPKAKKEPKNEKKIKKPSSSSAEAAPKAKKTASESVQVEESQPDDLKLIEGIGPKISSVLAEAGITTFKKLSTLSVDEIKETLKGKVRIAHPESWPEQAKLAADGAMEKLKALQDSLIGGRKK